ncbi:hypothetical protein GCM10010409_01460 [Mycolicibacterium diernhoferi]
MTDRSLSWECIVDRVAARELQAFTCTSDFPKTPDGRKLPHPKQWEREAQSHLRECSKRLKNGDLLLVGRTDDQTIVAAAHLIFDTAPPLMEVHIGCLAVSVSVRGQGGSVANEALAVATELALEQASSSGLDAVLTATIHTKNRPSELLAARAGFEPLSVPTNDYQSWALRLNA